MLLSSAYILHIKSLIFRGKLLIKKSSGPKKDPCGAPDLMSSRLEVYSSTL